MTADTERKDRASRLMEAQPTLEKHHAHTLLALRYKKIHEDPTFNGDQGNLQLQLEVYTDVVCRMNEHELLNELARVEEFLPKTWDEIKEAWDD